MCRVGTGFFSTVEESVEPRSAALIERNIFASRDDLKQNQAFRFCCRWTVADIFHDFENPEVEVRCALSDQQSRVSSANGSREFVFGRRLVRRLSKRGQFISGSKATCICVADRRKALGLITILCADVKRRLKQLAPRFGTPNSS